MPIKAAEPHPGAVRTGPSGPSMAVLNPAYFGRIYKPEALWNDFDREAEANGDDEYLVSYGIKGA